MIQHLNQAALKPAAKIRPIQNQENILRPIDNLPEKNLKKLPNFLNSSQENIPCLKKPSFTQKPQFSVLKCQHDFKFLLFQISTSYQDGDIEAWFRAYHPNVKMQEACWSAVNLMTQFPFLSQLQIGHKDLIYLHKFMKPKIFCDLNIAHSVLSSPIFERFISLKKDILPSSLQNYQDGDLIAYLYGEEQQDFAVFLAMCAHQSGTLMIEIPLEVGQQDFMGLCSLFPNIDKIGFKLSPAVNVEGLTCLKKIKNISSLNMSGGHYSEISKDILNNQNLQDLTLSNVNREVKIDIILPKLNQLTLDNVKKTIFTQKTNFPHLQSFFLSSSTSSLADFPFLNKENQFKKISFSGCPKLGKMPNALSYHQLEELEISATSLSLSDFVKFAEKTGNIKRAHICWVKDIDENNTFLNHDHFIQEILKKYNPQISF